jgi:tripartite-type tricarboxylate transporter receptor subunit TctC
MNLSRRHFMRVAATIAALPVAQHIASAQTYPTRPVRWIVPYAAGGPTDIVARLLGQWLSERLGQQFVIENRPGAGTNIGTEAVVRSPADGYTLLLVSPANAIDATLYDKLNFNFIRDIAPIASILRMANLVVVNPAVPVKTIPEFIAYGKANPRKLNMASSGNGTSAHVSGELFKMMTTVDMVHIPYRGAAPAMTDLLAGHIQVYFGNLGSSVEYVRSGKLRALAVTTATRAEALPDLPTVAEFVPGYEASAFYGLGAPRGVPAEVVDRLNSEINSGLADASIRARLAEIGGIPLTGSPADFGKLIADETEKWAKVVKFSGAKPGDPADTTSGLGQGRKNSQ